MKRKIKIPFVNNKTEVPVVKFRLDNGYEGYAVIDTGSESTVFDKDFVKQNKESFKIDITHDKINFVGVSNEKNAVPIIYASSIFNFIHIDIEIKGMVISLAHISEHCRESGDDIEIAVLIGSDILTRLGAKLNYRKKEMTV